VYSKLFRNIIYLLSIISYEIDISEFLYHISKFYREILVEMYKQSEEEYALDSYPKNDGGVFYSSQ